MGFALIEEAYGMNFDKEPYNYANCYQQNQPKEQFSNLNESMPKVVTIENTRHHAPVNPSNPRHPFFNDGYKHTSDINTNDAVMNKMITNYNDGSKLFSCDDLDSHFRKCKKCRRKYKNSNKKNGIDLDTVFVMYLIGLFVLIFAVEKYFK